MVSPDADDDEMHTFRLEELNEIMERIRWEASESGGSMDVTAVSLHQRAMQRLAERRLARRRLLLSESSSGGGGGGGFGSGFRAAAVSEAHTGGSWFRGAIQRAGSAYRHLMDETTSNGVGAATEEPQEPSFVCSRRGSNYMPSAARRSPPSVDAHATKRRDSIGAALAEIEGGYGHGNGTTAAARTGLTRNGSDRSSLSDGGGCSSDRDEISSEGRGSTRSLPDGTAARRSDAGPGRSPPGPPGLRRGDGRRSRSASPAVPRRGATSSGGLLLDGDGRRGGSAVENGPVPAPRERPGSSSSSRAPPPSGLGDGGVGVGGSPASSLGAAGAGGGGVCAFVHRGISLPGNGTADGAAAAVDRASRGGFSRRISLPGNATTTTTTTTPLRQRRSSLTASAGGGRRGSVTHRRGSVAGGGGGGRRGSLASVDERRASLVGACCAASTNNDDDIRGSIHVQDLPAPSSHRRRGSRGSHESFLSMESGLMSQASFQESSADGLICGWKPRRRRSVASLSSCGGGSFADNRLYVDFPHGSDNSIAALDSLDDSSVIYKASYRLVDGNRMSVKN